MEAITQFVNTIDPRIFYAAIAGVTWLIIYAWRRLSIDSWNFVTRHKPALEALPAVLLSALMASQPKWGAGLWVSVQEALIGVLFGGGGAIAAHHAMKAYNGGKPKQKGETT